jgi:hypothetical protein
VKAQTKFDEKIVTFPLGWVMSIEQIFEKSQYFCFNSWLGILKPTVFV